MQRSGLFIHVANLFLNLHLVKTTEWQAYRAIIESIRQGIVAKENYEKNFESSEFTAINIQEYTGDFKKAQLFCSDALSIAQSKDLITVIEVQGKGRSDRNLLNHIQDIITCLLDYEPKDCRQEYQTKKIFITVRTMRGQDLYAFEIVNDNIRKLKHLYDQMQKGFIRDIGEKITTFLTNYLTKSVNLFVTSFIMDKIQSNKPSSYRITDFNSDEFKSKILEDLKNEEFIELTIANVYKSIVGESEEEFNNGIFERLANKVLDAQTEMEFDHFSDKTIRLTIENIYGAGVRNVLLNGLRLAIEDIIKHVRVTQSQYFAGGFRKYALWLSKKRITPGQCNHEDLLEEFCIEQGEETRTLPNFIGEFNVFEIKWIKSSSLLTLRPVCIDNHLRIVLNGKLTIDNINLFFSILSTFKQYSGNTNSQVIFLDLKKSLDLMWVFNKDGDLTLLEKNEQSSFDSQDFSIQKSTVITKKGGVSYAQMSAFDSNTTNATSELSALSRAYNLSRNKPITNDNQFYIAMKKVDVALSFEDDAKDNCFESHKTVKVSITSDLTSFFLTIKTFKDHRHIELTRKFVSHTNNKTKYVPCGLIHDGDEKFETIEVRYLPNFIRHLRSTQVLSASDDLEVFDYYRPASYVVDAVSFPVIGKSPAELDTMVLTKHLKIQNNIVEHFGKDMKTRVFSLKFSMSEFLTRKVYDKKWERLTKEFLLNSGLDVFVLEKAIDEFLLDHGVYLPANDIEILGINTQRYRVEVTALVRDDRSTIIFLSRREFETDFEYCPLKKLLDIFCDVIKDPKYEFESHPFSYLLKTCYTEVHPIAYIFRCISDFRLTLHNTIDRDLEYDTNMEPVKQMSYLVAECIFSEKLVPEISGTASTTAQNPETCYALSVKRILQAQVIYMIKLIKFQKRILASKTVFHLKILSLNNFDYEDELKIEALKYAITAVSE